MIEQSGPSGKNKFNASTDLDTLIHAIVAPLDHLEKGLADQSYHYLMSGQYPEILLTLRQLSNDRLTLLLGSPLTSTWFFHQSMLNTEEKKSAKYSDQARDQLYQKQFTQLEDVQLVRLGHWLSACVSCLKLQPLYVNTPDWLSALLTDPLVASIKAQRYKMQQQPLHLSDFERGDWHIDRLNQILTAEEAAGHEDQLIGILFDRNGINEYNKQDYKLLLALPGLEHYLTQHIDQVKLVASTMTSHGQLVLLDYLKDQPRLLNLLSQQVVELALSSTKNVRDTATGLIGSLDPELALQHLQVYLFDGKGHQRSYAADLLSRQGDHHLNLLQQALEQEKVKSVQHTIQAALQRIETQRRAQSIDLEFPAVEAIAEQNLPSSLIDLLKENYAEMLDKHKQYAEQEIENNKVYGTYQSQWAQKRYQDFQKYNIDKHSVEIYEQLNGEREFVRFNDLNIIYHGNKIQRLPEYTLYHALRAMKISGTTLHWSTVFEFRAEPRHFIDLDLRQLESILEQLNYTHPARIIADGYLQEYQDGLNHRITEADKVVPFFHLHPEFIAEALGLLPSRAAHYYHFSASKAIKLLEKFPQIPQQYIGKLLELALGQAKTTRLEAQHLLTKLPDIHLQAIEALNNGKQDLRVNAIEWLARLSHQDAIAPLYALLKKEKKEVVIAAALTALEQLGEDISDYLTPEKLLKDAQKGLKGNITVAFNWFDFDTLPKAQWQDGSEVNPSIIKWWVILAEKLKDPVPNALLQRYVELLHPKSQQQLGLFLLQSFIQYDTRHPSIEEATEVAVKQAPSLLKSYQDSYRRYGQQYPDYYGRYANITLEQVQEEIKRGHLAIYLGSAIKNKGMLALAFQTSASTAVKILQDYMKHHYQRRSQIEAMLSSLAVQNDPIIIQLLLSISRRYRTASVQNLAKSLVEDIAERNGWSRDQLADRTIPTAGLDDQGVLSLDYGQRTLHASLDSQDKFILKNEDGKVLKALPSPRQGDDEAQIKDTKAQWSNAKKELKQVLDLQTQRLYESMCSERLWSVADWLEYILVHPIMSRLIQRLVWLEVDDTGKIVNQFRPTEDGSLINLDDDEITLDSTNQVKLAHAVLIDAETIQAWQAHFKDYKIKPLFDQMSHKLPELNDKNYIDDHKGWITDTFTLRGVLNKLGYQRATIEDGGSFDRYYKAYDSLGLSAVIGFSGSYVPEENIDAVLYDLSFEEQTARSWQDDKISLKDIAKVLLAESYADYLQVANACRGFDEQWQKKTPW